MEVEAKNGGHLCDGNLSETKSCGNEVCEAPVDCSVGTWSGWSECTSSCGGGQQDRKRDIITPEKFGGKPCEGKLTEMQPCNEFQCADVQDCEAWINY